MKALICLYLVYCFLIDGLTNQYGFIDKRILLAGDLALLCFLCIVIFRSNRLISGLLKEPFLISLLAVLAFIVIAGLVYNQVSLLASFAGLRYYFKFAILFLLPFVIKFNSQDFDFLIKSCIYVAFLQFPITLLQRFYFYSGVDSGDPVTGTFLTSGILTLYLFSVYSFYVAKFYQGYISSSKFLLVSFILTVPCFINETKITMVLMPIVFLVPMLVRNIRNIKVVLSVLLVFPIFISSFVAIYDIFVAQRWGYGIIDFLLMEDRVKNYLYTGNDEYGLYSNVGKFDSIVLAIDFVFLDPFRTILGYGVGNVSEMTTLTSLRGEYYFYVQLYGVSMTTVSKLIWELGIGGLAVFVLFAIRAYRKISKLTSDPRFEHIAGITTTLFVIFAVSIFYKNILDASLMGVILFLLAITLRTQSSIVFFERVVELLKKEKIV